MNSIDGIKCVILEDGREIHLNDESNISITIVHDGKITFVHQIDNSTEDSGGGSLYLSKNGLYLLFFYYSGQSEEAFFLFKVGYGLELVYSSGYLSGEAANYNFSNNEKLLIQIIPITCAEWWGLAEDYSQEDENGKIFFDFGCINILDIEKKIFSEHTIRIYPSENWIPSKDDYDPFIPFEMTDDNTLMISMPWGEQILRLPLEDLICWEI